MNSEEHEMLVRTVKAMTDDGWNEVVRVLSKQLFGYSETTEEMLFWERLYDFVLTLPDQS